MYYISHNTDLFYSIGYVLKVTQYSYLNKQIYAIFRFQSQ